MGTEDSRLTAVLRDPGRWAGGYGLVGPSLGVGGLTDARLAARQLAPERRSQADEKRTHFWVREA